MPKRTNEFQRLIFFLQHELSAEADVTESKMLRNRLTGSLVEVDIVIETFTGGVPIIVSVECTTSKSRAATVEWVREMIGKHQDLVTNKLVLVSGSGFSKEALALSEARGVEAITFETAQDFDWSGAIRELLSKKDLNIARFDIREKSWTIGFHPDEKSRVDLLDQNKIDHTCMILDAQGDDIASIQVLGTNMLRDKSIVERVMDRWVRDRKTEFKVTWNAPEGAIVQDVDGESYKIDRFEVNGICEVESTPVRLSPAQYGATKVAYGKVTDIFSGQPGEATIFIAEQEGQDTVGGLGFSSDSGFGKAIFPMQKPSTTYDESN